MSRLTEPPTLESLRARRAEILEIAATHGAHNVRIFGSVARGEARSDSDIDFVVDLESGRTLFDLSELILDLQEALSRGVHVVEIRQRTPRGEKILRQAVPL
jgi:predicted nucleotidyltransferase